MSWFAIPSTEEAKPFEPGEFAAHIRERWPDAEVTERDSENITLDVVTTAGEERVDWNLLGSADGVAIDRDLRAAAEIAVWFRSLVPAEIPLVFCDEGYTSSVDLTPTTTVDELLHAFEGASG